MVMTDWTTTRLAIGFVVVLVYVALFLIGVFAVEGAIRRWDEERR